MWIVASHSLRQANDDDNINYFEKKKPYRLASVNDLMSIIIIPFDLLSTQTNTNLLHFRENNTDNA